jgi:biotin carboxylase
MTPTFLLLEMQGQQVLVAEAAKERGLRTVALGHDPLRTSGPFAVREGVIDEYLHIESWSDEDTVRRLVREVERGNDIVGVHASFEPTQRYAIELRGRLGLPHNTVEDTLHVLDKGWVRRRLAAEGLTRLRHTTLREALTWNTWQFDGPAVLKPANGTASVLCFIVGSLDELHRAAATAQNATIPNALMHDYVMAHGEFVLEELAEGELLSVESLVSRGRIQHVGLTGRYLLANDPVVEQGLFFPYPHPRAPEIIDTVARFHRSLNIVEGATHIEVMVPDSGPIELIDCNLRFAGIGAIALASDAFGVPFGRCLADLACGEEPELPPVDRPRRYAVDVAVMPPAGVTEFHDITFAPGTTRHRVNKKIGGTLSGRNNQIDSVAWFAVTGTTAAEAHRNALNARAATILNGAPLGDDPPLICARHLTAELAAS